MKGEIHAGYTVYKGIRYASASRFAPAVLEELKEESEALSWPPIFWQAGRMPGTFYDKEFYDTDPVYEMSEDAFYLNLYVPDNAENAPVLFWIHGGAFDHGFSWEKEFDGGALAEKGIVVVTIGYRVGIPGFFAAEGMPLSLGCQDQITALQWVHRYISRFGGDPEKICIAGQSAGAMSVEYLLHQKEVHPLIAGAILQSGVGINGFLTKAQAEKTAQDFLAYAGCSLQELQCMEIEKLMALQNRYLQKHPLAFAPVLETVRNTSLPDLPLLVGSCLNDLFTQTLDLKKERGMLYDGCIRLGEDLKERKNVFVYDFLHPLPGDSAGAFHSGELWYTFASLNHCWRPMNEEDRKLAQEMSDAWARFVKEGNPGWKPYPYIKEFA